MMAKKSCWQLLTHLGLRPDRKSTRLNSSHANISYAVFCLKKKKRIHLLPPVDPHIKGCHDKPYITLASLASHVHIASEQPPHQQLRTHILTPSNPISLIPC